MRLPLTPLRQSGLMARLHIRVEAVRGLVTGRQTGSSSSAKCRPYYTVSLMPGTAGPKQQGHGGGGADMEYG